MAALLDVARDGSGFGRVVSSPAGIDCGSDCTSAWANGTVVTLTAIPDGSNVFAGWGGACAGTGPCVVTLSAARRVTATFGLTLSVDDASVAENGGTPAKFTVTVSGTPRKTASVQYATANGTATAGSDYTAASGTLTFYQNDSGTLSRSVNVSIVGDTAVEPDETFTFVLSDPVNAILARGTGTGTIRDDDVRLTVTKLGAGVGTVTQLYGGINCGTVCTYDYGKGSSVTLNAYPGIGSVFGGWGAPARAPLRAAR